MATDQDVRLQDYLDDKLQAAADFETLDSLIETLKSQQDLLKKQLVEAKEAQSIAEQASRDHATQLQQKATAFQQQQAAIDRTMMIVTQSETSDDAVARFQGVMDALRRFDVAAAYVEMLKEVDGLQNQCLELLDQDVDRALEPYKRLQELSAGLQPLHEAAEGAAPHLIDFVSKTTDAVRTSVVKKLSSNLETTLKKIGWPKENAIIPSGLIDEWRLHVGRLLDVQFPELIKLGEENRNRVSKTEPAVLLPFEVLTQPLALRFQFHFSGDRMTNRVDKPEYFLTHVLDLIADYASFVSENLQPLLLKHFRSSDLAFTPGYIDATSALITALLPLLRRKLASILPEVSRSPNLLSNLIHEVISFDAKLLEEWNYTPLSPSTPFRGLSHYILSDLGYFRAWFAVERDFALSRYEAIISDANTGLLDYDSVDESMTKPTKAAIRVNDLLETITDRYRPLTSFNQKIKFLIDIQIAVFDRFHSRLNGGLEAYLTRSSTVARTVHGVSSADSAEISGVRGLDRLCRVFGSAEYLEKAMSDWSEDVFFLDLWDELQFRSQNPGSLKGDLSMRDIRTKTSTSVGAEAGGLDELQGALFDETGASYHRLRVRSEQTLVETLNYDVRNALRSYARVSTWASMSSSTGSEANLTAELDAAARLLDEYLGFLSKALGRTPLRRIVRQLGHSIQSFMWDSVLIRHSFSTAGAGQFAADVRGLWTVIDRYAGKNQGRLSMARLSDGLRILCLPVKGEIPRDMNQDDVGDGVDPWKMGLWEVERRVFASNESARDVLEDLGLESLSESDAREVIKKRVEISS
ncbi:hypothetical protein MBLNU457_g3025t1 [Dothideomycetes sp. NU457]